jgi:hypothetical protein
VGAAAAVIQQFVNNGGGLVIGAQAWYWAYTNPILQHPSNLVLKTMGILVSSIIDADDYTFTGSPPSQIGHIDGAGLSCIADSCTGNTSSPCYISVDADLAGAMQALLDAARYEPLDEAFWTTLSQVFTTKNV